MQQGNVVDIGTAVRDMLADPAALGRRVVILDEHGTYWPIGLAELLGRAGVEVEIVTRNQVVGEELRQTMDQGWVFPRLTKLGVTLTPAHTAEGTDLELRSSWGGATVAVHRIGDCVTPRAAGDAIVEGERLGRAL